MRNRLSSASNDGRIELWTIALDAFRAHPLDGTGADTFEILYYEHRHERDRRRQRPLALHRDARRSWGWSAWPVVLLFVLGTLVGLAPARRGRDRALYAALFSAGLAWALHAGVDWDWQMPAASLWFAALGGLALGRPGWRRGKTRATSAQIRALVAGAAVVGVGVFPALVLASQISPEPGDRQRTQRATARAPTNWRAIRSTSSHTRAPPWQIEALCAVRDGQYGLARADLRGGLAEDPERLAAPGGARGDHGARRR